MTGGAFVVAAVALAFIAMGLVALARPGHLMSYFGLPRRRICAMKCVRSMAGSGLHSAG
jgi:hypothetical protein